MNQQLVSLRNNIKYTGSLIQLNTYMFLVLLIVLNILTVSHSIPSSQSSLAHLIELLGKATKTDSIHVEGQELDFKTGISIASIWVQFMNILLRCQAEVSENCVMLI